MAVGLPSVCMQGLPLPAPYSRHSQFLIPLTNLCLSSEAQAQLGCPSRCLQGLVGGRAGWLETKPVQQR
jgi:hypothetical protein